MKKAKRPTRDARIALRLPADVRRAVEREAAAQRRTVSDLVLIMISDALAVRGGR